MSVWVLGHNIANDDDEDDEDGGRERKGRLPQNAKQKQRWVSLDAYTAHWLESIHSLDEWTVMS